MFQRSGDVTGRSGSVRIGWRARLAEDLAAARRRDPAVNSNVELLLGYPGMHAIWIHRLTHRMWQDPRLRTPARLLSLWTRVWTGVEIHPGAVIGRRLFIDHATGIVIGETAEVGDDVMMYHDVTLGGRNLAKVKRHPTIGNHVMLGSGARVLGPVTVGDYAQIGANAVVVRDVPAKATVVGIPGRVRMPGELAPRVADGELEAVDPAIWI
jgi:serine O-acetyltransferase